MFTSFVFRPRSLVSVLGVMAFFTTGLSAQAESVDLSGWYLSIGAAAAYDSARPTVDYSYVNKYGGADDVSKSGTQSLSSDGPSLTPQVSIDYFMKLGERTPYLLGFSLTADGGSAEQKYKTGVYDLPAPTMGGTDAPVYSMTTTVKTENHWSIGVLPAMILRERWLGFAKFSYHEMKAKVSSVGSETSGGFNNPVYTNASANANFSGYGIGVGTLYHISPRLALRADVDYVSYNRVSLAASSFTSTIDEASISQSNLQLQPQILSTSVSVSYRF